MKLYFIVVFALLLIGTAGLNCQAQTAANGGWQSITRCHFTFDLPETLQEATDHPAGSCVANFNGSDLFVQMDYGHNNAPSDKDKSTSEYRSTTATIGGRRARIVTYRSIPVVGGRQQPVDWVTEVHLVTSAASRKFPLGTALLLTITSTNPDHAEAVKRIYNSLRFKA
jgi:hypothetical protein